jgi:hypothetical protein
VFTLFASRTARPAEAPAAHEWTPRGTVVAQRYRALEGATVLVYTADTGDDRHWYATACLGCTYRAATSGNFHMDETEAATLANTHAANCRAMPRPVPERPDHTTAAQLIRTVLMDSRRYGPDRPCGSDRANVVQMVAFHAYRVGLQRTTGWITHLLTQMADGEPSFISAAPNYSRTGTDFTVLPFPATPAPKGRPLV